MIRLYIYMTPVCGIASLINIVSLSPREVSGLMCHVELYGSLPGKSGVLCDKE
jgi:hypothetical protein